LGAYPPSLIMSDEHSPALSVATNSSTKVREFVAAV
jgi:hypothetical protein